MFLQEKSVNISVAKDCNWPEEYVVSMNREPEENINYKVVINHEDQYSIWPVARDNPLGWRTLEKRGSKEECLAYIKEVWTDMHPLSLRQKLETGK